MRPWKILERYFVNVTKSQKGRTYVNGMYTPAWDRKTSGTDPGGTYT